MMGAVSPNLFEPAKKQSEWWWISTYFDKEKKRFHGKSIISERKKSSLDKSGLSESLNLNSWCGLEALSGLDNWTAMFEWMIGQKVTWLIERNPPRCETFCTKLSPEVFILIKHHEVFLLLVFFSLALHQSIKTRHYIIMHGMWKTTSYSNVTWLWSWNVWWRWVMRFFWLVFWAEWQLARYAHYLKIVLFLLAKTGNRRYKYSSPSI